MSEPEEPPSLDYASSKTPRALESRIRVEQTQGGTRFVDPRGAPGSVRGYKTVGWAAIAVAGVTLLATTLNRRPQHQVLELLWAVGVLAAGAVALWQSGKFSAKPTILEVDASGLHVTHPVEGYLHFPRSEIVDVYCDSTMGRGVRIQNCLVVRAGGRTICMLHFRPFEEVQWLAGELRRLLNIDVPKTRA